jgi:hypothetical protein
MAEETGFDFSSLFGSAIDWMGENPQYTMAGIGALGTLLDPAKDTTNVTQQRTQLPDYIAPYAGRVLNRAESIANEDYIPYTGSRLADFTPDQKAAFERFRTMNPMTGQQTQGAGIVGEAANRLLQGGNTTWNQQYADQYMSPYQQSVIDIAKREAMRDYEKQLPGMDAAAVKAGAFGGDRQAILQAEAQRNLGTRLSDIQTQGLQSAYTNAQGQFNSDMNRQGTMLGAATGAGQTLAGIGQNAFQNQLAVNQGILGIGNQQQALNQRSADIGYESFLSQRDDPLRKLGIMQQGMQGLPMTQTATANTTQAPTLTQQLISNGIGGYMMGGGK